MKDNRIFIWYKLYAWVVGRAIDNYHEYAGYSFSTYCVYPNHKSKWVSKD